MRRIDSRAANIVRSANASQESHCEARKNRVGARTGCSAREPELLQQAEPGKPLPGHGAIVRRCAPRSRRKSIGWPRAMRSGSSDVGARSPHRHASPDTGCNHPLTAIPTERQGHRHNRSGPRPDFEASSLDRCQTTRMRPDSGRMFGPCRQPARSRSLVLASCTTESNDPVSIRHQTGSTRGRCQRQHTS